MVSEKVFARVVVSNDAIDVDVERKQAQAIASLPDSITTSTYREGTKMSHMNFNKWCQSQQILPRATLQGAATWQNLVA